MKTCTAFGDITHNLPEKKISHKMKRIVVFLEGRQHEKDGKACTFSTV